MEISEFKNWPKETLYNLLLQSYKSNPKLVNLYKKDWIDFDNFMYNNLQFTNNCGFISSINKDPIGFFSWNPEKLPEHIEIDHNCIIEKFQQNGYGTKQLNLALEQIKNLSPKKIIVRTGDIPFFIPAKKMYESAGFEKVRTIPNYINQLVPKTVEYESVL